MSPDHHVHPRHEVSRMGAFGPYYPPYLQEAVDHAERLVAVLRQLDGRRARESASTWLIGRVEEVECLVGELTREWRRCEMSGTDTATEVMVYVQALHRGLAIHFGELAPSCCVNSLVITASPASFLEITRSFPPSAPTPGGDTGSTWGDVRDEELLDATHVPGSHAPPFARPRLPWALRKPEDDEALTATYVPK